MSDIEEQNNFGEEKEEPIVNEEEETGTKVVSNPIEDTELITIAILGILSACSGWAIATSFFQDVLDEYLYNDDEDYTGEYDWVVGACGAILGIVLVFFAYVVKLHKFIIKMFVPDKA